MFHRLEFFRVWLHVEVSGDQDWFVFSFHRLIDESYRGQARVWVEREMCVTQGIVRIFETKEGTWLFLSRQGYVLVAARFLAGECGDSV